MLRGRQISVPGTLDLALHALDASYQPQSDIWQAYPSMPWNGGKDDVYWVPWTPVTQDNVAALLASARR